MWKTYSNSFAHLCLLLLFLEALELKETFLVPEGWPFSNWALGLCRRWTRNSLQRRGRWESLEKKRTLTVFKYTAVYFNVLYLRRRAFFLVSFTKHNQPVQCIVVLQILCSPATLHIFNHMVLQKLFEELHCLLPCDIWAKVAVAAKQLVEPVHSSWGSEAGGMMTKVLAVFPDRHTSPKQTSHFIPLKNKKKTI